MDKHDFDAPGFMPEITAAKFLSISKGMGRVLTEQQAATYLSLAPGALQKLRPDGPAFHKICGINVYEITELDAWADACDSYSVTDHDHAA